MTTTLRPSTTRAAISDIEQEVLSAALCRSARLPDLEQHFDDNILSLADRRYRDLGLQELLIHAAQANGYEGRSLRGDLPTVLEAGFSTESLPGILSNVANKFLLAGFQSVESSWRAIAAIRNVPDFKPVTSYRLTGASQYAKVGPGGEITHGTLGEEKYTNQADTYGRMIGISRQDIINDDLGALSTVPKKLGRGAALCLNEVFWSTFLDNAAFFTAMNGGLVSGTDTALTVDGLTKAEVAFLERTDPEGKPLGIEPKLLLVPNNLSVPASQLMHSLEIRDTGAGAAYPTANPHTGKFQIVRSSYLAASSSQANADPRAWYLLADPQDLAVIEVAFLNGSVEPTIEQAQADFSTLGIQMRGWHDFGVSMQDARAAIKMAGK